MATRPIKIAIVGDDSQLKKTLRNTSKNLEGFGKRVAKIGITSAAAFGATAVAIGTKADTAFREFAGEGLASFLGSRQVCVCPACEWFPGCGSGICPSETPDLSQPDPATRGDRTNRNGDPTSRTARRASRLLSGNVSHRPAPSPLRKLG